MRPRSTASFTTSSIRSRVSMIRLSGRMTPLVMASRSSATFLPEKSSPVRADAADAADAAVWPALRAPLAALCCRPRALPPAFAARLRAGEALEDVLDLRADDEREVDPEPLRALDLRAVDAELDLRAVDAAVDLRAVEPDLRAAGLRAVDPDDLRVDDPAARRLEDDAPPLPLFDSAIALLL
jgi:hypothetical protein